MRDDKAGVEPYNDAGGHVDLPAYNARAQQSGHGANAGYAVPEEQYGYDTSYRGAHP
jgi:hypothetical protein